MKNTLIYLILSTFFYQSLQCQTVNSYLAGYSDQNKEGYLQPLADLTISGFNSGLPLSARIGNNLYFSLNFTGLYITPASSQKTFIATTHESFSTPTSREVPTIIGANEIVKVQGENGTEFWFPTGYELKYLPWLIPQFTLGGIAGTEITGRFFTYDSKGDFGKFEQIGAGLRHSIDQYFLADKPIAINLGYQYNSVDIGRYMNFLSHYAYIQGGYQIGKLDLLAYAGYQKGDFDINYTYNSNGTQETLDVALKNKDAVLAGLAAKMQLGFFSISAGVAGPKPLTATTNFGFRFIAKSANTSITNQ